MYFQVSGARAPDRRLVLAGLSPARLVAARLSTGLILALAASAAALLALAARSGIDTPARVLAGTVMFAVIYLAIGALVGAMVPSPVNGTVLIRFIWILDVFFGPRWARRTRLPPAGCPPHFVTLWMVDLTSRHGGRLGDTPGPCTRIQVRLRPTAGGCAGVTRPVGFPTLRPGCPSPPAGGSRTSALRRGSPRRR